MNLWQKVALLFSYISQVLDKSRKGAIQLIPGNTFFLFVFAILLIQGRATACSKVILLTYCTTLYCEYSPIFFSFWFVNYTMHMKTKYFGVFLNVIIQLINTSHPHTNTLHFCPHSLWGNHKTTGTTLLLFNLKATNALHVYKTVIISTKSLVHFRCT